MEREPTRNPRIRRAWRVVPFGSPIVLVADDPAKRGEAARQLIRIGYDDLRGHLDDGVRAWRDAGYEVVEETA